MASYAIRCTIHKGSWEDYQKLHAGLASLGCKRTIVGGNGKVYDLPDATYVCETSDSLERLRDAVYQVAKRVSPTQEMPLVIVFVRGEASWYLNTTKA